MISPYNETPNDSRFSENRLKKMYSFDENQTMINTQFIYAQGYGLTVTSNRIEPPQQELEEEVSAWEQMGDGLDTDAKDDVEEG